MRVGTKSVLFGGHCFLVHPLAVAVAWWRLYGFPFDPRLWFAFVLHDIGYVGLPDMDGERGKYHPATGAYWMGRLFGPEWRKFTAGHSRYYADLVGLPVSRLMRADKYATVITPYWLHRVLITLSGEWREYLTYHAEATGRASYPETWAGVMAYARDLRRDWERYGPEAKDASTK